MTNESSQYAAAGVDIAAAVQAKNMIAAALRSTHGPQVLAALGAFGGCFAAGELAAMTEPVLVASTDGVGTKTLIAAALGQYAGVGQDLVNHCVNDILVQGARPLFFLDYVAAARLDPPMIAAVVEGVAAACRENDCALLGGETAEMPQVYLEGAFDLAGTIVGVVDRAALLPRPDVAPGDAILALPSSGLHTNGYSLARRIAAGLPEGYASRPALLGGASLGEALLAVHRSYLHDVETLRAAVPLKALAHITGGGLFDNLPRVLPEGCGARIERGSWEIPPIFQFLCAQGQISETEAFQVFNMGLGMLALLPAASLDAALAALPTTRPVGTVTSTPGVQLA